MTPEPPPQPTPEPSSALPAPAAWGAWPLVRPVSPARIWIWGIAYWALLGGLTALGPRICGNVTSRYLAIEALVERRTLAVERSPMLAWTGTPDLVRFGDHLYSDKPPALPALAAPVYAALRLFDIRIGRSPRDFLAANFVLTWLVTGFASGLTLVALRAWLQGVPIPAWGADLLTIAFGLLSPLLTYGVTFNNHSVAAAGVAGAWALTLIGGGGRHPGRRAFLAGLAAGLAAVTDLPIGALTIAGAGLIQGACGRWCLGAFAAGLIGPVLLHVALQSAVTGSPLPAEFYPKAFEYPGSYWATPEGQWHETGPRWQFGLDFLVGRSGAFTVFPALWFGVAGLGAVVLARRGSPLAPYRPAAVLIGGAFAVLVGYYVWGVRRTDFAGASWGARHLLAVSVPIFAFAALGLSRPRGVARWLALAVFGLALGVGGIYAERGMINPWSRIETRAATDPLLRLTQAGALYRSGTFRNEQGVTIRGEAR